MRTYKEAAAIAAMGLAAACSAGPTTADAPAAESSAAASARAPERGDVAGKVGREQRVGSEKLVDRVDRIGLAADTLDSLKASSAAPPKTSTQIYKAVAPATVIVRVQDGLGSGVIVDPAGWVLTNHHVIANGKADDFKYRATIILGALSKRTGAMERAAEEYEAEVYKADKLRDIALLKIVDPPANLPSVALAADKPIPGNPVVALGHAGAGMLWALKSGEISALGKLSETLSELVAFKDDPDGRKAKEAFKRYVEGKNLGTIIQSTCNILPGDSGGPLLNDRGELIGLNVFARRDQGTGGLLSFHVHLDELRAFMQRRPSKPAQLLPDPWLEGGGDVSLEDADLDGRVDVLMMQGRQPCSFCPRQSTAVFIDADQSTFAAQPPPDDLHDLYDKRAFDAEAIYLQLENDVLIWYDSDDDGRFDKLLVDTGTTGLVSAGYDIGADGSLARKDALDRTKIFQSALVDSKLRSRFARITRAAFPERYTDAPAPLSQTLPDPIGTTGTVIPGDLDEDGTRDAVDISTPFSKRLLIDVDQSFASRIAPFTNMRDVDKSLLDAEIAVVSQSTHMWVFYDRDDDQKYDLVLHAPGPRVYVATDAWTLDAAGNKTPAPEHVGRKLIRPLLLSRSDLASRASTMVASALLEIMSAKGDDGFDSFPHPVDDHRGTGMELMDLPAAGRAIVTVVGRGSDGYLIDLDRSSALFGPSDKLDIAKIVGGGRFDDEFAYFQRNGVAWTYYDTDGHEGYDVVLVSLDPASGNVAAGYRIAGKVATHDGALSSGKLVRPSLFKSPLLKSRLQGFAADLFADAMVGD